MATTSSPRARARASVIGPMTAARTGVARVGATSTKFSTAEGLANADELAGIDVEVQAQIAEGFDFAKNSPYPDGATASDYIYSS